jgi:hypothetical protein
MIDEPGSFFGISNSAKPARGLHDMSLMSNDPKACLEARGDFRSRTLLFIEDKNSGARLALAGWKERAAAAKRGNQNRQVNMAALTRRRAEADDGNIVELLRDSLAVR